MTLKDYWQALGDRQMRPTAIRVALIVGTILFSINHGSAVLSGRMTYNRWIAALFTYLVPYCVNIHGQASSRIQSQKETPQPDLTLSSR